MDRPEARPPPEHVDVIIVGAGLSGVGAACHLQAEHPARTYAILEARDAIGGTWDLFRYPGIRSDSDMYTLGYSFKPWTEEKSIADGPSILDYVRSTAAEHDVERHVRFGHRVLRAEWSSDDACWTVEAQRADTQETVELTCGFLLVCSGYYRYDEGYTPEFPGAERFGGQIVHPQHWDDGVEYDGKRVVVIGSGATAVTLVPALAATAAHVTMLQRSPSYILPVPGEDRIAHSLRRFLPTRAAYAAVRWKNVLGMTLLFQLSRRRPRLVRKLIRAGVARRLPPGFDVDTHFAPTYDPWDQRMCFVPDGDLLNAIAAGQASVVTDHVERFVERGVQLRSGRVLDADLIVTATGLNMLALGGIDLAVDGRGVEPGERMSYRGMLLSGVPNLAVAFGYTNASWTLKCDLTCAYVCRLLSYMDEHGYVQCTPTNDDPSIAEEPFMDFSSGYVQRAIHLFPKQGSKRPWRLHQNYALDILSLRYSALDDGALRFSRRSSRASAGAPGQAQAALA